MRLPGRHGYFAEEALWGNEFIYNVRVGLPSLPGAELADTIDYADLLHLVKEANQKPRRLLEELLSELETRIREAFPQISMLSVSIRKMNPPLGCAVECSEVKFEKTYS